jgi:hypothetical protein
MTLDLDIPEKLQSTFRRIMKRVPSELKEDSEFQRTLSLYLKIGGEKLARQRIELTKKKFQEGYLLIKRLVPEQVQDDTSEDETEEETSQDSENEENNDDGNVT